MADGWTDFSDSELRRRLLQRGVETEEAIALVARREEPAAIWAITAWLAR